MKNSLCFSFMYSASGIASTSSSLRSRPALVFQALASFGSGLCFSRATASSGWFICRVGGRGGAKRSAKRDVGGGRGAWTGATKYFGVPLPLRGTTPGGITWGAAAAGAGAGAGAAGGVGFLVVMGAVLAADVAVASLAAGPVFAGAGVADFTGVGGVAGVRWALEGSRGRGLQRAPAASLRAADAAGLALLGRRWWCGGLVLPCRCAHDGLLCSTTAGPFRTAWIVVNRVRAAGREGGRDQTRHCSRPCCRKMSRGRSMPMNTILLFFFSPGAHFGPTIAAHQLVHALEDDLAVGCPAYIRTPL